MTKENISLEPRAAKLTKSGRVNTPKGRILRATFFEPYLKPDAKPGAKAKYSGAIGIPKGADISALVTLWQTAAKEKFGDRLKNKVFLDKLKKPIKKCAECLNSKTGEINTGFDDPRFEFYIWPTSTLKPGVNNRLNKPIEESSLVYPGCWGLFNVHAYAYEFDGNCGVSFGLDNVQILDDDEMLPIGRMSRSVDEFEAVAGADAGGGDSDSVFDE